MTGRVQPPFYTRKKLQIASCTNSQDIDCAYECFCPDWGPRASARPFSVSGSDVGGRGIWPVWQKLFLEGRIAPKPMYLRSRYAGGCSIGNLFHPVFKHAVRNTGHRRPRPSGADHLMIGRWEEVHYAVRLPTTTSYGSILQEAKTCTSTVTKSPRLRRYKPCSFLWLSGSG